MDCVFKRIVGMRASRLIKAQVNILISLTQYIYHSLLYFNVYLFISPQIFQKDNKNTEEIPTVLTTLVGKEVCVIIDVVKGIEEYEFVLNAIYNYVANPANASIFETATPPDFPTINLSHVSVF